MFSIFNDMFHIATGQRPNGPPRHWADRHRGPVSDRNQRESDRHRRRRGLDRSGLR